MSRRLKQGAIVGTTVAMGLALFGPAALAAGPDRATLDAAPAWTAKAAVVGHTNASQVLHLSAVLNLRDAAGATRLADAISDPASPSYRKFVSAASWRAQFAPTSSQVDSVTGWLTSQGFSITDVPANARYVGFTGTAAQAEKAFGTTLQEFSRGGTTVTAPAAAVSVPSNLAGTVAGISGLDGSDISTPSHIAPTADAGATATAAVQTAATPSGQLPPPGPVFKNSGPCSAYYGEKPATGFPQILTMPLTYAPCGYKPGQVRSAYGMDYAEKQGLDGRGVTVAVVDAFASPTIAKDARQYATANDPSHPLKSYQLTQSLPGSYTHIAACAASGWYGEETLDVEAVHAEAPAAKIAYVGAQSCYNNDLDAAVNSVVDGNLATIVTNSYGSAGEPSTRSAVAAEHQTALQAAAQGVTLSFSSGDSGDDILATGSRQVDYEASDPYVTAVGGTSLAVGKQGNYQFEQGWGTGKAILTKGKWAPNPPAFVYGGGGGTSQLFAEPAYQKGVVPSSIANHFGSSGRAVPDVSMVGDPSTGFLVGQTQTFPDGSLQYSEYRIGGTSLSSPLFAGIIAVASQKAGGAFGFLNPTLYKLAGSSAYTDVNAGRAVTTGVVRVDFANAFDASQGTITSLRTFNQTGTIYTRKGYDDVTGVGSPHGLSFLTALSK